MSKVQNETTSGLHLDSSGSPVALVKADTEEAYSDIYSLLQSYINDNDQASWDCLKKKADYIYSNLRILLDTLDQKTGLKHQIVSQLSQGKKLLFKANGVSVDVIDDETHGAGLGAPICTHWLFVAALMRCFHDHYNINYYQMIFGEAATTTEMFADKYSVLAGRTITREAALEGKSGDFYGGWGFYFVRKYLYERHPKNHRDNPMNGYENSITGDYLPPGRANNRLMLYDLNNVLSADRGRRIKIEDGANFNEITIHKVVIGGEGSEKQDYPGCVLINVPILKMHMQDLITNAIKNLGIGLYPSYCLNEDKKTFEYSHHRNFKSKLPHSPWIMELDEETLLPITDSNGNYVREKTSGFSGTQCDIVRGIQCQGILLLTVCDALHIMNISHNPDGATVPVSEGFMFASLDPLALDYCCARYCFNQIPMVQGNALKKEHNWPTEFVQLVPRCFIKDGNIHTTTAYDSPLFRYSFFDYAEKRGLGTKEYYVTGLDTTTDTPLASIDGHIGRIEPNCFIELITDTMYYNPGTLLHHLQVTVLSYLQCHDTLANTSLYDELMSIYDENNDGVIDYDEKGRGFDNAQLAYLSRLYNTTYSKLHILKRDALMPRYYLKYTNKNWNKENLDFLRDRLMIAIVNQAFTLSKLDGLYPDLFVPTMSFGNGQWPSWDTAFYLYYTGALYGSNQFNQVSLTSMYGNVFQYVDIRYNNGRYTSTSDPIKTYFEDVSKTGTLLPFTLYVPEEYATLDTIPVPNVLSTTDKSKLFTIKLEEIW